MSKDKWEGLGAPEVYELELACKVVSQALGCTCYLVGSALERRDFRDVDVRAIMPDSQFRKWFRKGRHSAGWYLSATCLSLYLSKVTGLKVDFQIQSQSDSNAMYGDKRRHPLGAIGTWVPGDPPC